MPSSSHHSLVPSGSQVSTACPGFSANWRMGTLVRAMKSLAPTLSIRFFTTFSELATPCARERLSAQKQAPPLLVSDAFGHWVLWASLMSKARGLQGICDQRCEAPNPTVLGSHAVHQALHQTVSELARP